MNFFEKFKQAAGFTQTERRVILFLTAALVFGAGIKLYKSAFIHRQRFDYSALDSEFTARSGAPLKDDSLAGEHSGSWSYPDTSGRLYVPKSALPAARSIDVNTATGEELMRLPGVGRVIAERIIVYREENGGFETLEELRNVKGIGKKKLERIVPFCRIGK